LCRHKRGWNVSEQARLGTTSMDPVYIEKSEEDEIVE
jgi:hypothetical protein